MQPKDVGNSGLEKIFHTFIKKLSALQRQAKYLALKDLQNTKDLNLKINETHDIDASSSASTTDNNDEEIITVSGPVIKIHEHLTDTLEVAGRNLNTSQGLEGTQVFYLMVCLSDELMLNMEWQGKEFWQDHSLENHFFQTQIGGEEVFNRMASVLHRLDPNQRIIAKLYLDALNLGFCGKFATQTDNKLKLLKRELYRFVYQEELPSTLNNQHISILSSQPQHLYQGTKTIELPDLNYWIKASVGVFVTYLITSYLLWTNVSDDMHQILQQIFSITQQQAIGIK